VDSLEKGRLDLRLAELVGGTLLENLLPDELSEESSHVDEMGRWMREGGLNTVLLKSEEVVTLLQKMPCIKL
jgi:hypothetical protein